jgi:hypothetical protein
MGKRSLICALMAGAFAGGCDRDAVPDAFRPAKAGGCPDLVGDYALADPAQAQLLINATGPPAVRDWSSASIERGASGRLRLVLRRSPGTVLIEAMELRRRSPHEYRVWREQTLLALGIATPVVAARFGPAGTARPGPVVSLERELPDSTGCEDGWTGIGASRELPPPIADGSAQPIEYGYVQMSRAGDGALLVRMRVSRANATDWVFFGQPIVYHTHGHDRWYRFAALPRSTDVRLGPTKLEPVRGEVQHADAERLARELAIEAEAWLRSRLSPEVSVTLVRRTQFDPVAMRLGPDAVRLEIAGTFGRVHEPDPFQRLLRGSARVRDIELSRRERRDPKRDYALVRFTWRAKDEAAR